MGYVETIRAIDIPEAKKEAERLQSSRNPVGTLTQKIQELWSSVKTGIEKVTKVTSDVLGVVKKVKGVMVEILPENLIRKRFPNEYSATYGHAGQRMNPSALSHSNIPSQSPPIKDDTIQASTGKPKESSEVGNLEKQLAGLTSPSEEKTKDKVLEPKPEQEPLPDWLLPISIGLLGVILLTRSK